MRASDTISALATALALFQSTISNPTRNREVTVRSDKGNYKFEYATFDAILNLVRPALSKHELAFVQGIDTIDGKPFVVTRLTHSSGEWLEAATLIVAAGTGPQAFGSAISYAKRYALTSMLGIASEEDDDGNAAEGNHAEKRDRPARAANTAHPNAPQPTDEPPRELTQAEKAIQWAQQSLAKIKGMKSVAEIDEWEAKAHPHLDKLAENHRDTWQLLKRRMTDARKSLEQKEAA